MTGAHATNIRNVTTITDITNVTNINNIHYAYRTIATTSVPADVFRSGNRSRTAWLACHRSDLREHKSCRIRTSTRRGKPSFRANP